MTNKLHTRIFLILAAIILVLSCIPRFYDIMKFLPYYSIDENDIVEYAIGFLGGDLDQRFYSYGPLLGYILAGLYKLLSVFSGEGLDEYGRQIFFENTSHFYYTARFMNGIFSLATGAVMFKIVENLWNRRIAIFALPLLVFPFVEILTNYNTRVDSLLGLCYALSIWMMVRNVEQPKLWQLLLSALFAGMAFASKPLPMLLMLPSLGLGLLFMQFQVKKANTTASKKPKKAKEKRKGKQTKRKKQAQQTKASVSTPKQIVEVPSGNLFMRTLKAVPSLLTDKRLYIFLAALLFSMYLFFPHAFTNWDAANGFKAQQLSRVSYEGGKSGIPGWRLDHYFKNIGLPFVLLSVSGIFFSLFWAWQKKKLTQLFVLLFPVVFIAVFSRSPARVYWYAAITHFLSLGIVVWGALIIEKVKAPAVRLGSLLLLIIIALFYPVQKQLNRSLDYNTKGDYTEIHTALSANKWVEENISDNTPIALYGYYVRLPRLVDPDANKQAAIGEYFMYYRSGNKYYINQYAQAHRDYIADASNKRYKLTTSLKVKNQNGQEQTVNLRYKDEQLDTYLYDLLKSENISYLICDEPMDESWDSRLIKSFTKEDYSYGSEIFIYRIDA